MAPQQRDARSAQRVHEGLPLALAAQRGVFQAPGRCQGIADQRGPGRRDAQVLVIGTWHHHLTEGSTKGAGQWREHDFGAGIRRRQEGRQFQRRDHPGQEARQIEGPATQGLLPDLIHRPSQMQRRQRLGIGDRAIEDDDFAKRMRVAAHQCRDAGRQSQPKSGIPFAENPEVLDLYFSQSHMPSPEGSLKHISPTKT